ASRRARIVGWGDMARPAARAPPVQRRLVGSPDLLTKESGMTRFTRAARAVATMAAALALALPPTAATRQHPPNCNANLLDEITSRPTAAASAGQIATYLVTAVDRTLQPPGCVPGSAGCQVGCNTNNVTADFCCPGPTGDPAVPPSPLCINLVTN